MFTATIRYSKSYFERNSEKVSLQDALVFRYLYDHAAHRLAVLHDPVRFAAVDGRFDRLAGDDLAFFLEVIVPKAKLLQGSVVEGFLLITKTSITP